jgi:hypothetical protein
MYLFWQPAQLWENSVIRLRLGEVLKVDFYCLLRCRLLLLLSISMGVEQLLDFLGHSTYMKTFLQVT